jgi:hypothetical protein
VGKVLFIKIYCTVDWNGVIKSLVHRDSWYCRLKQCNNRVVLTTEKYKDCRGRVGLFFYWNAFGIKNIVWEKIINVNFSGV